MVKKPWGALSRRLGGPRRRHHGTESHRAMRRRIASPRSRHCCVAYAGQVPPIKRAKDAWAKATSQPSNLHAKVEGLVPAECKGLAHDADSFREPPRNTVPPWHRLEAHRLVRALLRSDHNDSRRAIWSPHFSGGCCMGGGSPSAVELARACGWPDAYIRRRHEPGALFTPSRAGGSR